MILVYPPSAKPSEPPAGIAGLAGALGSHGIKCSVVDANLEALLYLKEIRGKEAIIRSDRWTARALRNFSRNYAALKSRDTYDNIDRYKRAVIDLNRAVEKSSVTDAIPGLANYRHNELSPLRSADLAWAAEHPADNPYYPYFSERLSALVRKERPSAIGFSLNYLSQALCAFAMIGYVRRHFPGILILLGGGLVTSWMNNPAWKDPFSGLVDKCIAGPGEHKLLAIAGINDTRRSHYVPDYDSLPLNDYLAPGGILPYSASSGCYWKQCSFCPERAENNPYIPAPVETVRDDLNALILKTRPSLVHLLDNSVSAALLKNLAGNPLGVPWYGFARFSGLLTDIDFCTELRRSGCVMLKLGLESGDQHVLDRMRKGIDLETASLVLKTLKKAGIAAYVYLLFGTPPETLPAARNTLEFVVRHCGEIAFLNIAIFNMPVSAEHVSGYETGSFYEGDLSLYTDFRHPEYWDRKNVRRFLDGEFKRHKAVAGIMRNDPPVFTSNHAPFFAPHPDVRLSDRRTC